MVRPAQFRGDQTLIHINIVLPLDLKEKAKDQNINLSGCLREALASKLNALQTVKTTIALSDEEQKAQATLNEIKLKRIEAEEKAKADAIKFSKDLTLQALESKWHELNMLNREKANVAYIKYRNDEKFKTLSREEQLKAWIAAAEAAL